MVISYHSSLQQEKVGQTETNHFSWAYQKIEVTGQTTTLKSRDTGSSRRKQTQSHLVQKPLES